MLLMSWGGETADKIEGLRNIELETKLFKDRIGRLGIRHNDLIPANVLWDERVRSMIFIDFEAATSVSGRVLQELSSNRKRKRGVEKEVETPNGAQQRYSCSI